jgi:6-phosphogluconolactonase (cycloisomerase 2 family)
MTAQVALYSAVDEDLTHYEVDLESASLARRNTVKAPAHIQYAWPHPSRRYLYVATSNRGPGLKADLNHVSAFRIDPASGGLAPHGEPRALPHRAVHICVDATGSYVLSAHNAPQPGITVTRINPDGTLGAHMPPAEELRYGTYPHQVRVSPSNRTTILVDRGNRDTYAKGAEPGALRLFRFEGGRHSDAAVAAPNGGHGFSPRHLDFHPARPWVYVALEAQSMLHMFRMAGDGLEPEPAFVRDTLADRANARPRQLAGTIHVHPNGRVVYVANRSDQTVERDGRKVFGGGENSIAVFALDAQTGEPTLLQHADTGCRHHVRTFALDPGGRMLVAASIKPMAVQEGERVVTVPAALAVFRVAGDGRLEFVRKYDVDTGSGRTQYWMGIVGLD